MATLSTLTVDLRTNSAKFSQGMTQAQGKLRSFGKAASGTGKLLAGVFGIGLTVGLGAFIKGTIDAVDATAKLSRATGISTETLTSLSYAASLAGGDTESLAKSTKTLVGAMFEAARGSKTYLDVFNLLGVSVKNTDGTLKDTDNILGEIADAFKGMEDGATKNAVAIRLFGRNATTMVNLLNQGSEGLREMRDEAESLGLVFGKEFAAKAEEANDNLTRLGSVLKGVLLKVLVELLPKIVNITNAMVQFSKEGNKIKEVAEGISSAFKVFSTIGTIIGVIFKAVGESVGAVASSIGFLINGEFRNAFDVLRNGQSDMIQLARDTVSDLKGIWADSGDSGSGGGAASGIKNALINPLIEASDAASKEGEKIKNKIEAIINKLTEQSALFGKSSGEIEIYRLTTLGASDAQIQLAQSLIASTNAQQELQDLMAEGASITESLRTPTEIYQAQIEKINDLLDAGAISYETYNRAVKEYQDQLTEASKKTTELGEFSLEAARRIQNALGDTLNDVLKGNFDDIGNNFANLLDRMVSDLIAAQLGKQLFGEFDKTGEVGGVFAGILDFLPKYASGTSFASGGPSIVGENGPEIVNLPAGATVTPNGAFGGGIMVTNNFVVQGQTDQRSQQQIAKAAFEGTQRAYRRNG